MTPEAADAHVARIRALLPPRQLELLEFLIRYWRNRTDVESAEKGYEVLHSFYNGRRRNRGRNALETAERGRRAVSVLRRKLELAYARLRAADDDGVRVAIKDGKAGYEPEFNASGSNGSTQRRAPAFEYLGENDAAMEYVTARVTLVDRIEDTAIRWNLSGSHYRAEVSNAFRDALRNSHVRFAAVTSTVPDQAYARVLSAAFAGTHRSRLTWYQLHRPAPIMNFMILFYRNGTEEVLFGYGTQRDDQPKSETAVFRSSDPQLVKEFQRLFKFLSSPRFSVPVAQGLTAVERLPECDVLETFHALPAAEIYSGIKDARSVRICTIFWSLDQFLPALRQALKAKCVMDFGLWDVDEPFVAARSHEAMGDTRALKGVIGTERKKLTALQSSGDIKIHTCIGPPSVNIYWLDELIYFSAYWRGPAGLGGPHFVVRDSTPTGEFLREQFYTMVPSARRE